MLTRLILVRRDGGPCILGLPVEQVTREVGDPIEDLAVGVIDGEKEGLD